MDETTLLWIAVAVLLTLHVCHKQRPAQGAPPAGYRRTGGTATAPTPATASAPVTGSDPAVAAQAIPLAF